MSCGDAGRYAHADNLHSQSIRFLVEPDEARVIIDEIEQAVRARWYEIARKEGVTEKDCETISGAFVYDGFRLAAGLEL
jgi:serine/threonine-protein kinase HipA